MNATRGFSRITVSPIAGALGAEVGGVDLSKYDIGSLRYFFSAAATMPQEVSLLDVEKALSMLQRMNVPVIGLVENMAGFVCAHCGHHFRIGAYERIRFLVDAGSFVETNAEE